MLFKKIKENTFGRKNYLAVLLLIIRIILRVIHYNLSRGQYESYTAPHYIY